MTLRLNGSTSGYVEVDSQAVGGNNTIQLPASNGSANQFLKNGSTAGTLGWSSMVEDSSGRLLVGTSSTVTGASDSKLELIQDGSGAPAHLTLGNSNTTPTTGDGIGMIRFYGKAGGVYEEGARITARYDASAGSGDKPCRLEFSTCSDASASPVERLRIRNSGEVLINQTNTLGVGIPLQVSGTAADWVSYFSNSRSPDPYGVHIHYNAAAPNGTSSEFLYCRDNAALRASIRSNGGLANFQANNVNLSDRNTKKDISPAADTWDCIKEWEIVNYRYKDQPDDADLNLGVIAQQVAESCPEVITIFQEATEDEPEKLGIKEQQMYWMAIKALQEAQLRIETLEASNADLAARLTALEANS